MNAAFVSSAGREGGRPASHCRFLETPSIPSWGRASKHNIGHLPSGAYPQTWVR